MTDAADVPRIVSDPRWAWISGLLACPICHATFAIDASRPGAALTCRDCGSRFAGAEDSGVLDLRCPAPARHVLEVRTGGTSYIELFDRVERAAPPVTFRGALPARVSRAFVSVLKDRLSGDAVVLEVGGRDGAYRDPMRGTGLKFVTTDYSSRDADLLADGHALPFTSECADAVLMQAVSQAFENPLVAFREVARVLRSDGLLLGTADCCAVFASSFYNLTPWGVLALLEASGLAAERWWVVKDALEFCGTNPGYPLVIKPILRLLSRLSRFPLLTPRNLLSGRPSMSLMTAGSFAFIARKRVG